jgi:hypothetical protein
LRAIAGFFRIQGDFHSGASYGHGHINDTYAVVFDQAGSPVRYLFQRINHHVFKNPSAVMENISRVTAHLREKLEAEWAAETSRRVLTLVPTADGRMWEMDEQGNHWRCYLFIEKARTYDQVATPGQAHQAARAYGRFQELLADLPAPRLRDTIPLFHHTRSRFEALRQAITDDPGGRAHGLREEIDFCLQREPMVDVLLTLQARGALPERVIHNDTKLDNVMIDDATGEGICVVDLDTVMPGLVLYDFGDLCRTAACARAEDERDLGEVEMRLDMFEAIARGYQATAGGFLIPPETEHLAFSAGLITFEVGMRFLTDHLLGDRYFKIERPGQNLDRARAQFRLVESFERHQAAMERVVKDVFG